MFSFKVKKCPRNQHFANNFMHKLVSSSAVLFPDLSTGLITGFAFYPPRLNQVGSMPSSWLNIQATIEHIKAITSLLHLAVSVIP